LFSGCTDEELEMIDSAADEVSVTTGTVLTTEGSAGRQAIVILSGRAEVTHDGLAAAVCGPGDCVGELAILANVPRSATLTALEDMELLVIPAQQLRPLLDEVPGLARRLLEGLAAWVAESDDTRS
jgi:CRP-like cAMP-binding protein